MSLSARLRDTQSRSCPRCQQQHLAFLGAFWACQRCGYAITGSALAAEPAGPNNPKGNG